jgi:type II secretory pathway pseudopilin PulG
MNIGDRHSIGLGRIVFDMVLVIISVLLALALGNWREDHEKAQLTRNVLAALAEEIDANRRGINEALDYQDRMTIAFRDSNLLYQKTGEFRFPDEAKGRQPSVRFSRAAYDSALVSQVLPRIGVDSLLKLSALYAEQDAYADQLRNYASATILTDFSDGARYLRLLSNEYAGLAETERRILPMLDAAGTAIACERGKGCPALITPGR